MTPVSLIYCISGLVAFFWPLATLLIKRHVLGAQWLSMAAVAATGATLLAYSTLFNTHLEGEYLLVLLFMIMALAVTPLTLMAISALTRPQGVSNTPRVLAIISALMLLLMVAAVALGGADMFRLWVRRGTEGNASLFFASSWRYNVVVAIHYYLFAVVLIAELLFGALFTVVNLRRFSRIVGEYHTSEKLPRTDLRRIQLSMLIADSLAVVSCLLYPFNSARPVWATLLLCTIQSAAIFAIGYSTYRLNYSAERLAATIRRYRTRGGDSLSSTARRVALYIEADGHYTEPDISVFQVAEALHISQDEVVDAVHRVHGTPFGSYIDSLRIHRATSWLIRHEEFDPDDLEQLTRLAHNCGYLTAEAFGKAFHTLTQQPINQWCRGGVS